MTYWTAPPKKYNMSSLSPSSSTLPAGTSPYSVANSANWNITYRITLTVGNDCSSSSAIGYFNLSNSACKQGNISNEFQSSLNIWPNPASDVLNFKFNNATEQPYNIAIYSLLGTKVSEQNGFANKGDNEINLSVTNLNKGMYVVKLTTAGKTVNQKIVIE